MTPHAVVPFAIFGSVSCLVWLALSRTLNREKDPHERLKILSGPAGRKQPAFGAIVAPVEGAIRRAAPTLSQVFMRRETQAAKLRRRLGYAGFHSPESAAKFLAAKVFLVIALATCGVAVGAVIRSDTAACLAGGATGVAIGLFLPELILARMGDSRRMRLFLTLPDAIDLIVVALDVGQGIEAAVAEVIAELRPQAPDLCDEFEVYQRQTHLGRSRQDAWRDLSRRSGVDDLAAFASVLAQAERFGSGIAGALRDLSDEIRVRRRHLAEERVQKTAVKLLLPLILFIFPGVLVVLVGPAGLSLARHFAGE